MVWGRIGCSRLVVKETLGRERAPQSALELRALRRVAEEVRVLILAVDEERDFPPRASLDLPDTLLEPLREAINALDSLSYSRLSQPHPPLWQQDVVRGRGMCGVLVAGTDGVDAVCILALGHDPLHGIPGEVDEGG